MLMKILEDENIKRILIVVGVLIVCIVVLKIVFAKLANQYIKNHKQQLFDENSPLTEKSKNLGQMLLTKLDTYNKYIKKLGLNQKYECSSSVVSNASKDKVKYLIKYSKIDYTEECLERVDFCTTYVQSLKNLQKGMKDLQKNIKSSLPVYVRWFVAQDEMPYIVCDLDYKITKIHNPVFYFSYVSPAGNSKRSCKIEITQKILKDIQSEISAKIVKSGHIKMQRSAMTNDLREAIKKRDNYTCCICGNSVYKEPNLLLEVDHIIPVSKGGTSEASNLQTLCWRCNRKKSNK